jgi:hypothetical protein
MPETMPEASVMAEIDRLNAQIQRMQTVVDAAVKWREWNDPAPDWAADQALAAAVDAFQTA